MNGLTNSFRRIGRALSPPILWDFAGRLKTRSGVGTFQGPMPSWGAALAGSESWDSPVIASKTLEAMSKVRDGDAEFQLDTELFDRVIYSEAILTLLLLASSGRKDRLHIIDFGGVSELITFRIERYSGV
jgi:hypothetical protein